MKHGRFEWMACGLLSQVKNMCAWKIEHACEWVTRERKRKKVHRNAFERRKREQSTEREKRLMKIEFAYEIVEKFHQKLLLFSLPWTLALSHFIYMILYPTVQKVRKRNVNVLKPVNKMRQRHRHRALMACMSVQLFVIYCMVLYLLGNFSYIHTDWAYVPQM